MTMTPKQCRLAAAAMEAGEPMDITKAIELLRSHADALEEIERLKGTIGRYMMANNTLAERAENAERRAERLKFHAEAMANAIQFGDMAILTVAKAAADSYRSDYPKDPK